MKRSIALMAGIQQSAPLHPLLTAPAGNVSRLPVTNFAVSPEFFGMHTQVDPYDQPVESVPFATVRNLNYGDWPTLQTGPDTYDDDAMQKLVRMTDRCVGERQADFIFVHSFTPPWASASPTNPSGGWLPDGSADPLSDNQVLYNFLNGALLPLIAPKFKTAGRQLFIEGRNEANDPTFWHGTRAQLYAECLVIWQAVQDYNTANTDTVKVISPSVSQPYYLANNLAPGSDINLPTMADAGILDVCDVVGYHAYSGSVEIETDFPAHVSNIRAQSNKPIFMTEAGDYEIVDRGWRDIARWNLKCRATGIERFCYYAYDNEGVPEMALNQSSVLLASATTAHNTLSAPANIGWVSYYNDGSSAQLGALIDGVPTLI